MSISKEQLDHSLCGKSYVELKDLVQLIEDNFGYSVTLQRKKERHILTEEQKARITSFIFKDESVLSQLHQAMLRKGCLIISFGALILTTNSLAIRLHLWLGFFAAAPPTHLFPPSNPYTGKNQCPNALPLYLAHKVYLLHFRFPVLPFSRFSYTF